MKNRLKRTVAFVLSAAMLFGVIGMLPAFATTYTNVDQWKLTDTSGNHEYGLIAHSYYPKDHLTASISIENDHVFDNVVSSAAFEQEVYDYLAQKNIQDECVVQIHLDGWFNNRDTTGWYPFEIKSITYVPDRSQQKGENITAVFEVFCDTKGDTYEWRNGDGLIHFYISISGTGPIDPNAPEDLTGVTGWRLVLKGTSDAVATVPGNQNNTTPLFLPNIIMDATLTWEDYADVLLSMYDLQVSYNYNNNYIQTVKIKSFTHQSNGTYLIETAGTVIFKDSNLVMTPLVSVRTQNAGPSNFTNLVSWNLVGNRGVAANIGRWLEMKGWDYEEIQGNEEAFANVLLENYSFLVASDNNDNWRYSQIINITHESPAGFVNNTTRKVTFYKVTVFDSINGNNDFYIFFIDETDLDAITVDSNDPDGIRMNLFDYWINDDDNQNGNPWPHNGWDAIPPYDDHTYFDGGINAGRALKFFYMGWPEQRFRIGLWNHSTTTETNMRGIVEGVLNQRYPKLALDKGEYASSPGNDPLIDSGYDDAARTQSLDYLFDPTYKQNGKASYGNVTGLFQRNSAGYYYYDSKLNFAQYDALRNAFLLYNTWGVVPDGNTSSNGQFFPFNGVDDVFTLVQDENNQLSLTQITSRNARSDVYNHFFGFTMEVDFQQPKNGIINAGLPDEQHMVFQFAGDDDVWIFVDGVLVLDLGGIHSGAYGSIDFATGEVITGTSAVNSAGVAMGEQWDGTTLKALFDAAQAKYGLDMDEIEWNGDTFADNSLHTIKVFYLERGHGDSNLAMYFNLQPRVPHKIYKVDEDGNPLEGASFSIYAAKKSSGYIDRGIYNKASEFVPVNRDGSEATWSTVERLNAELLVTGEDGYVTLTGIDFASRALYAKKNGNLDDGIYYFLEETSPAPGHRVLPERLVLEYLPDDNNPNRGVFRVVNQYEVGAYASFSAILVDYADVLYYATASEDSDGNMTIDKAKDANGNEQEVKGGEDSHQSSALLFAVPMIYTNIGHGQRWYPIYGSNTDGFRVVDIYSADMSGSSDAQSAFRWALRHNLLAAAIRQAADVVGPDWYFHYDTITDPDGNPIDYRFTAELNNLPGEKERYLLYNNDSAVKIDGADLRLVGLLVDAEAMVSLINSFGGYVELDYYKSLSDEEKYLLLQNTLQDWNFEDKWDMLYSQGNPNWSDIRSALDKAYDENDADNTTFMRGVNMVYIDDFTRNYGSVFYIPNERRELRVLKQDPDGNVRSGATFAIYDSFADAVNDNDRLATGTTGDNGILIFSKTEDKSPANARSGFAEMDWDGFIDPDRDNFVWLKEIAPPEGLMLNEAIVQIYVGERTIYANASAYENDGGSPKLIEGEDGVSVWASVGKLFQSMEKFADSLLNSTLLDIDGHTSSFIPQNATDNPEAAEWKDLPGVSRLHFWDRFELGFTSSDYSTAHKKVEDTIFDEVFAVAQDGYIRVRPTQTSTADFRRQHSGEAGTLQSRRDELFYSDGTAIDLYNIFSPVNIVVIRNEYEGDADLRINKIVEGEASEAESKEYIFTITTDVEDVAGNTYDLEDLNGTKIGKITFSDGAAPYTATVIITGSGTVIIKELPTGDYTVREKEEDAHIDDYELKVSYSTEDALTVEEGKTVTVTIVNYYYTGSDDAECLLTISDGGHYGEEDCGEKDEVFLYKVTGKTLDDEIFELIVAVHGGGSTTIVVPPGHYVVEELDTWSWKYNNKETKGRDTEKAGFVVDEEWEISDDQITGERNIELTEHKEVVYSHERSDKNWLGGESSKDNHFTSADTPSEDPNEALAYDSRKRESVLTAVNIDEKRKLL